MLNTIDHFQRRLDGHLRAQGLRGTQQRDLILRVFVAAPGHPSIDELLQRARDEDRRVGHATIYRTMKLFVEAGIANERRFADGATKYEATLEEAHHDHLICTSCGAIEEFEDAEIEARQEAIAAQSGFRLQHHKMELYGLCPRCQGAAAAPGLRT